MLKNFQDGKPLRLLYVSQYFPPEMGAPSARVSELARMWVAQGHTVHVLTGFPNHPTGVLHDAYRRKIWRLFMRESVSGVNVLRCWLYPAANLGRVKRCLNYLSFMLSAILLGVLFAPRADVIIATSPQLLVGVVGYVLARLRGVPFVLEVRDLWPESLSAVDAVRPDSLLIRVLDRVAQFLYCKADLIVPVTDAFKTAITARGIDPNRIHVIKNGIDTRLFHPQVESDYLQRHYGYNGEFVVSYIGTLGMAHKIETILEVAERLKARSDIRFLLVGEGAEKEALMVRAAQRRLANVDFLGQQPRAVVPKLIAGSHACLVLLRKSALFRTVIPSKMFEFMGMGKPVILGVDGESQAILQRAGAGIHIESESAEALESAILALQRDAALRSRLGQSGRRYVELFHDRERLAADYLSILQQAVLGGAAQPALDSTALEAVSNSPASRSRKSA